MRISTAVIGRCARLGLLLAISLAALDASAQAPPTWASVQRSTAASPASGRSNGRSISLAADGSQYVVGQFEGTVSFGPVSITAGAGQGHLFLVKYSPAGTALWAAKMDASSDELNSNVAVDAAGNAYVTGYFTTSITLGATTLTTNGNDSYLVKYNAQGVQQWVRQGGAPDTFASGIAVDPSGNVAITGDFSNSVSFGGTALAGSGMFFYKFSPAGSVLQARYVADSGFADALAFDAVGNAYLTGSIYTATVFGSITLVSAGEQDAFLCKLDPAGTILWAQRAGGVDNDGAESITVDPAGNAVIGGYYDETFVGTAISSRFYLARFTSQGAPMWTRLITPAMNDFLSISDVAYDGRGGYFVTGSFQGSATFGATTLTTTAPSALFAARFDSQGTAVWADRAGHANSADGSAGYSVATDATGAAFLTGAVLGGVEFGALPATTGGLDTFVAKLSPGAVLSGTRPTAAGLVLKAYPNPAIDRVTVQLPSGGGRLVLTDALGRAVREQLLPAAAGEYTVELSGLRPGLYQLRAALGSGQVASASLQVR